MNWIVKNSIHTKFDVHIKKKENMSHNGEIFKSIVVCVTFIKSYPTHTHIVDH